MKIKGEISLKGIIQGTAIGLTLVLAVLYAAQDEGLVNFNLPEKTANTIGTYYKVTRVIDGDTIEVKMNSGLEKVRLIGINTPEIVDPRKPVECFAKEASNRMHSLASGQNVKLEFDDSQSYRDIYNRLLAYVYLQDGEMLNRKMIAEGYAYEYTYMAPYKYQKEFRDLQTFVQGSERGLWAKDTCNGSKEFPK